MTTKIPYVKMANGLTIYLDGKPVTVSATSPQYKLVLEGLEAGDEQAVRDAIEVKKAVVAKSFGKIALENGRLVFDGRPLAGALVDRILNVIAEAGDAGPLLLLLENLMDNPSKRAVDEFYDFVSACDLPITSDGFILAYKKVRDDYMDHYTGTMRNKIGDVLTVPRNSVDEDKDRTCSYGLHFCSKSYLPHYGGGAGRSRIMVVKINPADIVAIPSDYANAKGRCCKYVVVDEVRIGDDGSVLTPIKSNYNDQYESDEDFDEIADDEVQTVGSVAKAPVAKVAGSLSDDQVRKIRKMWDDNFSKAAIARAVGTSERTVGRVLSGETYTDVV